MTNLQQALQAAWAMHQAGQLGEAESLYRQIIAAEPQQPDPWHLFGLLAQQAGRHDVALEALARAAALRPTSAEFVSNLGLAYEAAGRLNEALACFQRAIQLAPQLAGVYSNLGNTLTRLGRLDEAVAQCRRAIELDPRLAPAYYNLGNALADLKRYDEATTSYRTCLQIDPRFAAAAFNQGTAEADRGNREAAVACYREAVRIDPQYAGAWNNLGVTLAEVGDAQAGREALERAIALQADFAEAHNNLANLLRDQADLEGAVAGYQRAIALKHDYAEAHNNLGATLREVGRMAEGERALRLALRLKPDYAEAYNNLAMTLREVGHFDEALATYREAIRCKPNFAQAHVNLGVALGEVGRIAEALAECERAIEIDPQHEQARSNRLLMLNYDPQIDPEWLQAEHRRFGHWLEARYPALPPLPARRASDPAGPLRVGYVSPDFRQHAVANFIRPVLEHHDRAAFQVCLYSAVSAPDDITRQIQNLGHAWRNVCGLSDRKVAQQVRADRIDILVDLAGHTAQNRLALFALKPAPVQATWLGYPNTTGLSTIDYRWTDAVTDPPDEPSGCSERLLRLPSGLCCFREPDRAPEPSPLPALASGRITFGSQHNLAKLNGRVLDLWARVLAAVPRSRLIVSRSTLRGSVRATLASELSRRGVSSDRLDLRCEPPRGGTYFDELHEIDIALDTFPWSSHTTTYESLWMGVPIITLYGPSHASRWAASILKILGLDEWIAYSEDEYVAKARQLTADLPPLARLRGQLRERMQQSPVCDATRFTRELEVVLRGMLSGDIGAWEQANVTR